MPILQIVGSVLLVCLAAGLLFLFAAAFSIARLSVFPPHSRVSGSPADFGASFEDVSFRSRDGVDLKGWLVRAPDAEPGKLAPNGLIVLCHGMAANRSNLMDWAEILWRRGYGLFMFDFRANGESGGRRCSIGHFETYDLLAAVDYIAARSDELSDNIGVFGFSMGGATAILAAAQDTRIRAVATLGAYASVDRAIRYRCKRHFGWLAPIVEWQIYRIEAIAHWFPVTPSAVSPLKAVGRISPRPLLLLQGHRDRIVPPSNGADLFEAAGEPKELCVLAGAAHSHIPEADRSLAYERLISFLTAALHTQAQAG